MSKGEPEAIFMLRFGNESPLTIEEKDRNKSIVQRHMVRDKERVIRYRGGGVAKGPGILSIVRLDIVLEHGAAKSRSNFSPSSTATCDWKNDWHRKKFSGFPFTRH